MKLVKLVRTPLDAMLAIERASDALEIMRKKERPSCHYERNCSSGVEEVIVSHKFYKEHQFLFKSSGWRKYESM